MIYQMQNSLLGDEVRLSYGKNVTFPPHMHESFEYMVVTEGTLHVRIGQQTYRVSAGNAMLFFPHQIHEFISKEDNYFRLCFFSPSLVEAFRQPNDGLIPSVNLFTPQRDYIRELELANGNPLRLKGILYTLCGEFNEGASYLSRPHGNTPIAAIFAYVEKHFRGECTLAGLARETGYHYVYLSRCFKQNTGLTFIALVNGYRINEACYALQQSDAPVLQIAYDCGFRSLRNFNRAFKKTIGKTPGEYRDAHKQRG